MVHGLTDATVWGMTKPAVVVWAVWGLTLGRPLGRRGRSERAAALDQAVAAIEHDDPASRRVGRTAETTAFCPVKARRAILGDGSLPPGCGGPWGLGLGGLLLWLAAREVSLADVGAVLAQADPGWVVSWWWSSARRFFVPCAGRFCWPLAVLTPRPCPTPCSCPACLSANFSMPWPLPALAIQPGLCGGSRGPQP